MPPARVVSWRSPSTPRSRARRGCTGDSSTTSRPARPASGPPRRRGLDIAAQEEDGRLVRGHAAAPIAAVVLLLTLLGAPAASASSRADLKVTKLTDPPASLEPGGTLAVSFTVRNSGAKKARSSSVVVLLSRDT